MCSAASASRVQRALLLVWTDIPAEMENEFNDWYDREHLRERVEVPGFISARRFAAISATPRYLALYEAQSAAVMMSDAYLALKRSRDARSRRFVRAFANTIKATCDVVSHEGVGEGAFLGLLPVTGEGGRLGAFRDWVSTVLLEEMVRDAAAVSATFAMANRETRAASATHDARAGDRHLDSVLIVEAERDAGVHAAMARVGPQVLKRHGVRPHFVARPIVFRRLYALHA